MSLNNDTFQLQGFLPSNGVAACQTLFTNAFSLALSGSTAQNADRGLGEQLFTVNSRSFTEIPKESVKCENKVSWCWNTLMFHQKTHKLQPQTSRSCFVSGNPTFDCQS